MWKQSPTMLFNWYLGARASANGRNKNGKHYELKTIEVQKLSYNLTIKSANKVTSSNTKVERSLNSFVEFVLKYNWKKMISIAFLQVKTHSYFTLKLELYDKDNEEIYAWREVRRINDKSWKNRSEKAIQKWENLMEIHWNKKKQTTENGKKIKILLWINLVLRYWKLVFLS